MQASAIKPSKPAQDPKDLEVDKTQQDAIEEHGGTPRLEPTRYGDWENKGRCIDF